MACREHLETLMLGPREWGQGRGRRSSHRKYLSEELALPNDSAEFSEVIFQVGVEGKVRIC